MRPALRRRPRAGIAVAVDELVAAAGGDDMRVPVPGGVAAAPADGLAAHFRTLRERLGLPRGAVAHLALLPPLADARLVTLPPLRREEAEAVLRRDPRRHFLNGAEARVIGAADRPRGAGGPLLAAAAPVSVVDGVTAAAESAGWRVGRIGAAHGAWAAAARAADVQAVVVVEGDAVHALQLREGRIAGLRRVPAAAAAQAATTAGGRALVLAAGVEERRALAEALGVEVVTAPTAADPREAAARHAAHAAPRLVTPRRATVLAAAGGRRAGLLAAAAVVLVALAGLVELWGVERELAAVRARRAALRAEVAPLLVLRDSLDRLHERGAAVRAAAQLAPAWTPSLLDVALLLPEDAHVTGLRTEGDTLVVDAVAGRAGAALQALRDAGSLRDVRLRGVVDREMREGSTALERFTFTARVVPPPPPPAMDGAETAPQGGSP